jgi:hypothetical protein
VSAASAQSVNVLARAVEEAAREFAESGQGLESAIRDEVASVRSALDKSLEAASQLLDSGAESTQRQIVGSVERLLARLALYEKNATNRMDEAAAKVGESTRKAAESTAARLVEFNGALVHTLRGLGNARQQTHEAEVEQGDVAE